MPLQSIQLKAAVRTKLQRKIRWLMAKGILHPSKKKDTSYDLGFCMHIQAVPKKKFDQLEFGKAEGIRAFIQSGTNVIGAADFLFTAKKLQLSYVHQGHALKLILTMLNKLEKIYAREKQNCYAEFIYFLLAPGPYILIKSDMKKQFYHLKEERLVKISADGLKKQISKILIQR